jgi:hypothetical protein
MDTTTDRRAPLDVRDLPLSTVAALADAGLLDHPGLPLGDHAVRVAAFNSSI